MPAPILVHPPLALILTEPGKPAMAELFPRDCGALDGHLLEVEEVGWVACECGGHRTLRCQCGLTMHFYGSRTEPRPPCTEPLAG